MKQMKQDYTLLKAFIIDHVEDLLKQPRSFIHHPFIDPGSVYDGNVWDWDTYWSVYGLLALSDDLPDEINERILVHARGNVLNFIDHQQPDGYIPMMIEVAEWPEPYLVMKHKEGVRMNMHKPFLARQTLLISQKQNDFEWVHALLEPLERYFTYYKTYLNENCGLYVWHDDIMIGMDNDPATFGRPFDSTANIYLNSFMVLELEAMSELLRTVGKPEACEPYDTHREALIAAIQAECWDKRDQIFYSVDVDIKTRKYDWFHQGLGVFWKTLPIKTRAWSSFIPLFAGFATPEQADALVKHIFDDETFGSPWGLCTLSKDEKMFDLSVTINPSNWLGPIWLVANYVIFSGLLRYGFRKEAEEMASRTLRLLGSDLEKSGSLHEYYDPFTGEPIMNGGFINWNMLGLNMFQELSTK